MSRSKHETETPAERRWRYRENRKRKRAGSAPLRKPRWVDPRQLDLFKSPGPPEPPVSSAPRLTDEEMADLIKDCF